MSRRANGGYALLSALVIVALAALAGASCIAAANALHTVSAADGGIAAMTAANAETLAMACETLRWSPAQSAGALTWTSDADAASEAEWSPLATSQRAPAVSLSVFSRGPAAVRHLKSTVELRTEGCAQGVVVATNATLTAATNIRGAGMCLGGSLLGRELLAFPPHDATLTTVDVVHGDLWPSAAVHALGGIWAQGTEIHEDGPSSSEWASDTDSHTQHDASRLAQLTRAPERRLMVALAEHSVSLDGALAEGVLDLSRFPAHAQSGDQPGACRGFVVYVRPVVGTALTIVGQRDVTECPVTLVVDGDALIGRHGGSRTTTVGALVVGGLLEVKAPFDHIGHVHAGRLDVAAAATIVVPADWRLHPPVGLTAPTIVGLAEH